MERDETQPTDDVIQDSSEAKDLQGYINDMSN